MTIIEPNDTAPRPGRRRWILPAAAAAVVVGVVAGLFMLDDEDSTPTDIVTSTTPTPPTTTPTTESLESGAQAVVDAFFTEYNAGRTDEVLAIFAPDLVVTENFGNLRPNPDNEPYQSWDQRLAWNHAQGEILSDPRCRVADEQPADRTRVECDYTTLDAVVQAVDGEPIPTVAWFTIADGQITELHQGYGDPDFATLGSPFDAWIEERHPDVTGAGFAAWTSRDEALDHGRLRADWAQEWAAFLVDSECEATEVCVPPEAVIDASASVDPAPPLPAPESGSTQASIVGDITWTLLEGNQTLPERVTHGIGGDFFGRDSDGTTWQSPDGVTWIQVEPTTGTVDNVVEIGDEIWATTAFDVEGPTELLRWDGADFQPVDLPDSTAPTMEGLHLTRTTLSQPVQLGDAAVVLRSMYHNVTLPETYEVTEPYLVEFGPTLHWDTAKQQFQVMLSHRPTRTDPRLVFDVVDGDRTRIEFRESEDVVATVDVPSGMSASELLARIARERVVHNELLVGGADGFTSVPTPWTYDRIGRMVVIGDRLVALVEPLNSDLNESPWATERELWSSIDGVAWQQHGLPAPIGSSIDHVDIASDGTDAILTIVSSGPGQQAEAWYTSDAETWIPANGAATFTAVRSTDFGWMLDDFGDDYGEDPTVIGVVISVSPDGLTWQQIPLVVNQPEADGPDWFGFGGRVTGIGNTIFLSMENDRGDRYLWVGLIEPF